MPYNAILSALIDELNDVGRVAYISWKTVQKWPETAQETLSKAGLLTAAPDTSSLECQGCEKGCFMDVIVQANEAESGRRAFIVCDKPDMQSRIGWVPVSMEHLQQWKTSARQVANVIAGLLGLDYKPNHQSDQAVFRLGMLKSSKGRRWVSLKIDPLLLEVNGFDLPVSEVLYFEADQMLIDRPRIDDCLNRAPRNVEKHYSPSTNRREARKRETLTMYQDWRDEYQRLRMKHRGMADTWYARKIEKMDIAKGRDSETIRKQMTK